MKKIFKTSYYAVWITILASTVTLSANQEAPGVAMPDMYQMPGNYAAPGVGPSPYGPGSYAAPGVAPAPGFGPGGMPPLSEEDIRQLEQLDHEIKKFVDTMPSDQRAEFDRQVATMQEKMSKMNEQELVKFMEDTFREAGLIEPGQQPPMPTPEPQPEPTPVPVPQVEEPVQEEVVEKPKPARQINDAREKLVVV